MPEFLRRTDLQSLVNAVRRAGYRCIGPQARDGAIVYDTLEQVDALPWGVTDEQAPGHYRLGRSEDRRCFAWATGPQALKPLVFRPRETLWSAARHDDGTIAFSSATRRSEPMAVIGVRACDLAALYIQDKHFVQDAYVDPGYRAAREDLFLVAVHCTHPAATCFCASTGDGPRAAYGFDLALTELEEGYQIEALSEKGRTLAGELPARPADAAEQRAADDALEAAAAQQSRSLPSRDLRHALFANLHHRRWQQVAERCLACGNCTCVCPTCFCSSEGEVPALDGVRTDHLREWDSCFTQRHSYITGWTIRASAAQRYRQWLTHKLGSWHDQYGRSGCVGCGRCITWCPVGIDITEEAQTICGRTAAR